MMQADVPSWQFPLDVYKDVSIEARRKARHDRRNDCARHR